jgi:hypothetical protein
MRGQSIPYLGQRNLDEKFQSSWNSEALGAKDTLEILVIHPKCLYNKGLMVYVSAILKLTPIFVESAVAPFRFQDPLSQIFDLKSSLR